MDGRVPREHGAQPPPASTACPGRHKHSRPRLLKSVPSSLQDEPLHVAAGLVIDVAPSVYVESSHLRPDTSLMQQPSPHVKPVEW